MITARVNRWSAVVAGLALLSGSAPTRASATSEPPELEGTIVFGRFGGESGTETIVRRQRRRHERTPSLSGHESCCPFVSDDGSRAVVAHLLPRRADTHG